MLLGSTAGPSTSSGAAGPHPSSNLLLPHPCILATAQDRAAQGSAEWRRAMAEVDAGVFAHLREGIKGGFDEAQYGPRVGFGNLKR